MKIRIFAKACALFGLALLVMACPQAAGDTDYGDTPISPGLSRTSALRVDTKAGEPQTEESIGLGGDGLPVKYVRTTEKYTVSAAFDDNVLLNPGADVIYPGSVLIGETIDDGTYQEITKGTKRPATISFSLQGVKDKDGNPGITSAKIVPTLSGYRALHSQVLGQTVEKTASAAFTFEETEVMSESNLAVGVMVGAGYTSPAVTLDVKAGFNFSQTEKNHRYLIKLMETFYTVDLDQEGTQLMTDIPKSVSGKYLPVYVSSVAYGRIAYFKVESSQKLTNIGANLNVLFQGPQASATAIADATSYFNSLNTKTTITTIGGSDTAVMTMAQFRDYIVNGGFKSGNPGQIIKYKLRFLHDNSVANIKYNGEYTIVKTVATYGKVRVGARLIGTSSNTTDMGSGDIELFGTMQVQPKGTAALMQRFFDKSQADYLSVQAQGKSWRYEGGTGHYDWGPTVYIDTNQPVLEVKLDITEYDPNPHPNNPYYTNYATKQKDAFETTLSDIRQVPRQTYRLWDGATTYTDFMVDFTLQNLF